MRANPVAALLRSGLVAAVAVGAGLVWCALAPQASEDPLDVGGAPFRPPRPAAGVEVAPGADLAGLVAAAAPGSVFLLAPGRYPGPLAIPAGVTVWGPPAAVLASTGEGTTVRLTGAGAALLGVTIDGSGSRYDQEDAAVHVGADDARVEGVTVRGAIYGLVVEQSRRVLVRGNFVRGRQEDTLGLRGDGLRVWETNDSRFEDNVLVDSRDLVIWYSSGNRITGNHVAGSRFGTHFMYSHGNFVAGNRYTGNVVGIFAMYSRDLELRDNLIAGCSGAAGIGIGLKESSALSIEDNVLVDAATGLYVDNSPYVPGTEVVLRGNDFRLCETAVVLHSSLRGVRFLDNDFRDNFLQVRVDGGGDAEGLLWEGNLFDDYAGYDLDHDGTGDLPHELRSLASQVVSRRPELAWFRGTPALAALDAVGRVLPIYRPKPILHDPRPRVTARLRR